MYVCMYVCLYVFMFVCSLRTVSHHDSVWMCGVWMCVVCGWCGVWMVCGWCVVVSSVCCVVYSGSGDARSMQLSLRSDGTIMSSESTRLIKEKKRQIT